MSRISWFRRLGPAALLLVSALAVSGCVAGELVAYDLPAEEAGYTLELDADGVHTVWEFTSAAVEQDAAPDGYPCITAGACQPEELIFLRYDLGLDLDNTAPARGNHTITVTGHYQAESPPTITALELEATFDGGTSWEPVAATPAGENTFTAKIRHPGLAETDGAVGLRVTATDSEGNTVRQTIPHAYGLR